ncbi:glycosyltransferase domain-containing protein [Afipia sp. DC4300-2b1]|uniref:glycosyltransferase domain-containing protein n=1 Tax=Afipia sp. DC4300-2b1 TaxID=2804672 RepID=UPI003CF87110
MFGYSEIFNDFSYEPDRTVDYICFTDDPDLQSENWQIRQVPKGLLDPTRAAKRIKILAHQYLGEYGSSLYVDNTIRLKRRPEEIFENFLDASASPLVCFRHPWRECVFQEAVAVLEAGYDDPGRVQEQMAWYRFLGYPCENGLTQSGFMLRRHNDPKLINVMETWAEQLLRFSLRDQLSFKVAAWFHGFEPAVKDLDWMSNNVLEWPVVKGHRLPRDFNDARYLELHPDVRVNRINPRKHFLLHGLNEGRLYK